MWRHNMFVLCGVTMSRFTDSDVTETQTKKWAFSLYLHLLRLPWFASHGLELSTHRHTHAQTHGILTGWVAPRSMREARLYTNVRVTLTSQREWRHTHINDTEGNVIYPVKRVSPIYMYTMYKRHNVRKWRHNVFVVSRWVVSQRVTSQWPRPRSGHSAFISIYSDCHGLQATA